LWRLISMYQILGDNLKHIRIDEYNNVSEPM